MSSNQTAPYTIPYTGASGKQAAEAFIPASSQKPGAVAQPAAPQDNKSEQAYQHPSIAEMPDTPIIGHSKGELKVMASGAGVGATSDLNSASRRSSIMAILPNGPSDAIPGRFSAASTGTDGVAIIHEEHRGSGDIHSSEMKEKTQDSEDAIPLGLDGASDALDLSTLTQDAHGNTQLFRQLLHQLQLARQETQDLRQENAHLQQLNDAATVWITKWYRLWVKDSWKIQDLKLDVQELKFDKDYLTTIALRVHSNLNRNDPDAYFNLPGELKEMLEDVREDWKYDEWYKTFVDPASDTYVPQNYPHQVDTQEDSDLEEMRGLGIHDASSCASSPA